MHFKYFLQVSGLALLTGAVSAQLDTDALGLNPILGSNPLGGNNGRAIHSVTPTSTPVPTSSSVASHKRSSNPSFRRIAKEEIGGNLAGKPLGNFVGRKSSPSAKPSSAIATPSSSPSGTPTAVRQSKRKIIGRNDGKYEADSTIPVNLGQILSGRDNENYQADSTIPVNLGQLSGRDTSSPDADSIVPGSLDGLLGDESSPSAKPSAQIPKPSSSGIPAKQTPAKHTKASPSSDGLSKTQAIPSATPTPSKIIRRRRRGNLGASSKSPVPTVTPSVTPAPAASTAVVPTRTSMQTKAHSTPLKVSSKETGVPKGSI